MAASISHSYTSWGEKLSDRIKVEPGITLYTESHWPDAFAIELLCQILDIPVGRRVEIDMRGGEHQPQEFKAQVNPYGEVPTAVCGKSIIYDAKVLAEYLDEERKLMPKTAIGRCKVRMLLGWARTCFSYHLRPIYDEYRSGEVSGRDLSSYRAGFIDQLNYIEALLKDSAYLVGNELTLADIFVYSVVRLCPSLGIDIEMEKFELVNAWLERVL